jgi:hypothetical protein
MYYISDNKEDLIQYNQRVAELETYDGTFTKDWANIIEHPIGNKFAIFKHEKYDDPNLPTLNDLDESWFDLPM